MQKIAFVFTLMSAVATVSNPAAAMATYRLTDIGVLPGYESSIAYDINDIGTVALTSAGSTWQAATYDTNGMLRGIGQPVAWSYSAVGGINNLGQIAGEVVQASGNQMAMKTTPTGVQLLGQGVGRAINNAGQVTGFAPGGAEPWWSTQATVWSNSMVRGLGILGTGVRSSGMDINNAGHVAGYSETTSMGDEHAFFHDGKNMHDLGTLPGGKWSSARGINEFDQVTGCSASASSPNNCHAVIWSAGQILDLGIIQGGSYSYGTEINDAGDVVGGADIAGGLRVAMLYKNGAMVNLNSLLQPDIASSWFLSEATAINNNGWIVGEAVFNGKTRAFLLTPIPEPSAGLLILAGFSAIAILRRHRRKIIVLR